MSLELMLAFALQAATAGQAPPPATPPPACDAAEYRQFDFWLGDWVVSRPDSDAVLGHNRIRRESGGCALHEHWTGASGYEGHSLNAFDRQRGRWMQVWVGAGGGVQKQRITWTPAADGSVQQHWQVSDDGDAWTTSFLGIYRRSGPAQDSGVPASGSGKSSKP